MVVFVEPAFVVTVVDDDEEGEEVTLLVDPKANDPNGEASFLLDSDAGPEEEPALDCAGV